MQSKKRLAIAILAVATVVAGLILAACGSSSAPAASPKASSSAPSVSPAASAPAASPAAGSPSASAAPKVDAEWAKVVEAAKKEGKVTLYGQWRAQAAEVFRKRFNAEYPGITLDLVTGSGSQTYQRIETELRSGKPVGDIGRAGSTSSREMKKAGFFQPFEPPILSDPSVKWVDQKMARMDPQHNFTPFSFNMYGLLVNTNLVKAGEEPRSYKDLADPKWKGKLIGFSPKLSGQGSVWYNVIGKGVLGPEPFAGPDYLEKMKSQDIAWSTNYDDGANLVARGEAAAFFPVPAGSAIRLREAKAPVKYMQMGKDGIITVVGWGVVKNAPHPNAAKVFINWLGTTEGQTALAEIGETPLRAGIPITAPENDPKGVTLVWFPTDESEAMLYPSMQEAADFFDIK